MSQPEERGVARLRQAGLPVDVFNEQLVRQVEALDDEEIRALVSIKSKLNAGLEESRNVLVHALGLF